MPRAAALLLCLSACAGPSRADMLTGDPSADGWSFAANSLQNGHYVRGAGNFAFDMYRRDFVVSASSPLVGAGWAVGDQVLGLGGVFRPVTAAEAGWSQFSGAAVNSLLTDGVRIVGKFGTSPDAWTPSTAAPGAGNGSGSFSNGDGGLGSVLLSTDPLVTFAGGAGTLLVPTFAYRWTGTAGSNGAVLNGGDVGRFLFTLSADNQLSSWEVLLNATAVQNLGSGLDTPGVYDAYNAAIQRGNSSSQLTDGRLPEPAPVPAPAAGLLVLIGGIAGAVLNRFGRKTGSGTDAVSV